MNQNIKSGELFTPFSDLTELLINLVKKLPNKPSIKVAFLGYQDLLLPNERWIQLMSIEKFKEDFVQAGVTQFGSGWAWLIKRSDGSLAITSTPNQDSPLMEGVSEETGTPVVGLDVWEHAYYLNYQNRRPDYVSAFWSLVDWNRAQEIFGA